MIARQTILEMDVGGCPFNGKDKVGNLPKLAGASCNLLPNGPPRTGQRLLRSFGVAITDYAEF